MIVSGAGHLTGGVVQGDTLQGNASGGGQMVGSLAAAYGTPGRDGGYYIPKIIQEDDGAILISFEGSNKNMAPIDDIRVVLPAGGSVSKDRYVNLLAEKWEDTEIPHKYAQIVTIDGVTENSQVDLTPSADQLAVFLDKALALVTENEDGIVTVYAIGQKPENDYTMQVTVTEVGE